MLDTGKDLSEYKGSPYAMGGCLLFFLQSLKEPVIPSIIFPKCSDPCTSFADARKYLLSISTVHYSVFHYIIAFLRDGALPHSNTNHLTVDTISM